MNEYRKKYYIDLIKNSFSLREVCLKAGLVVTTGNYDTLKKIIKDENIDVSHFKRQTKNVTEKRDITYYLKKDIKIGTSLLKKKLFQEELKEKRCECCGRTEWMDKPINLQLHHINGDNTDNRLENLQILCPNCHSYTDNYCGKNQKLNIKDKDIPKKRTYVDIELLQSLLNETDDINIVAQKLNRVPKTIKKYIKQYNIQKTETKITSYDVDKMIFLMKKYGNYTKVGLELGISDNAVRKRFKVLGYPTNIKELIEKL